MILCSEAIATNTAVRMKGDQHGAAVCVQCSWSDAATESRKKSILISHCLSVIAQLNYSITQLFLYPPETQLWSFCLCSGHYI